MAKDRANHVVVDTVAFFKNVQLQDIAENVYTIQGVVSEIRDAATRQRLAVLPYDLKYRDPSPESIMIISEFAKQTGDYRSLSAVDLKVLALTYQLTREHCGTEHLNLAPEKKVTVTSNTRPLVKATDIVGFYLPPKSHQDKDKVSVTQEMDSSSHQRDANDTGDVELILSQLEVEEYEQEGRDNRTGCDVREVGLGDGAQVVDAEIELDMTSIQDRPDNRVSEKAEGSGEDPASSGIGDAARSETAKSEAPSRVATGDDGEDVEEDDDDSDEDDRGFEGDGEDDDDEEGWITPENISRICQGVGGNLETAEGVTVGCMTADFAMQNVLIQIGIPILSVAGMLIKTAKSFVLRCRGCFKITNKMTKVFCPHCGNKTLDKVTVTTDQDGRQHVHLSHRKFVNKRGLKYPLPLPKGGKHSDNPILFEDQPIPQNYLSRKAQMTTDVFNTDYVVGCSPFAQKDTTSKSAQLGVRSFVSNAAHHRRNPNQVRPKKGRKK